MHLRTLTDEEVLGKAEAYTLQPQGLPPSAVALIDELAFRLNRTLGTHPKDRARNDRGLRVTPLLPDVRG